MTLGSALSYQPVELAFGTSGLRGLVADMTDLECYVNAAGFLRFLATNDGLKPGETLYVAEDLRDSSPRILRAVMAAITDGGYKAVYCGKIATPALAYYALQAGQPCIMVSGSHIPEDRNGIKFYKRAGEVLKEDEPLIKESVSHIRGELYGVDESSSKFNTDGSLKSAPELGAVDDNAEELYKQRYLSVFAANSLSGKKVVVYQQSAVARDMLVELFESLGAEVIAIERSDRFIPIDTENVTDEEKERFKHFSRQHPDAFAIISADGDSDRPIVVDETGTFHRGDVVGCVTTKYLGAKSAAVPVSSNDAGDAFCAANGIALTKTKIGSPYVISAMMAAKARPTVSWEVNGGFLVGSDIELHGKTLSALPTRDAMLPILCSVMAAQEAGVRLSELFDSLPKRYTGAGLIDDVDETAIQKFRVLSWNKAAMETMVATLLTNELGAIKTIDITDGVRIRFASDDVLHFRPSGNAPQFRVYTNASSQERADELVAQSISNDGYIKQLLNSL